MRFTSEAFCCCDLFSPIIFIFSLVRSAFLMMGMYTMWIREWLMSLSLFAVHISVYAGICLWNNGILAILDLPLPSPPLSPYASFAIWRRVIVCSFWFTLWYFPTYKHTIALSGFQFNSRLNIEFVWFLRVGMVNIQTGRSELRISSLIFSLFLFVAYDIHIGMHKIWTIYALLNNRQSTITNVGNDFVFHTYITDFSLIKYSKK